MENRKNRNKIRLKKEISKRHCKCLCKLYLYRQHMTGLILSGGKSENIAAKGESARCEQYFIFSKMVSRQISMLNRNKQYGKNSYHLKNMKILRQKQKLLVAFRKQCAGRQNNCRLQKI